MPVVNEILFRVDRDGLFKRLHLEPDSEFAEEVLALATKADSVGRPKAIYDEVMIESKDADGIRVRGIRFASRTLAMNLRNADRIYPYVCTCGAELDAIAIPPEDDFCQFGLDIIKEMALRQAAAALIEKVKIEFGLDKKATMNPGSGDRLLWPIEEQRPLFSLLGDVESAIGVHLTDSCLMLPNKSISGFYFSSDKEFHNCQLCKRDGCSNRHALFDQELWGQSMVEQGLENAE